MQLDVRRPHQAGANVAQDDRILGMLEENQRYWLCGCGQHVAPGSISQGLVESRPFRPVVGEEILLSDGPQDALGGGELIATLRSIFTEVHRHQLAVSEAVETAHTRNVQSVLEPADVPEV